ncbi:MAG: DUF6468 domain-containing protein [Alphaproteobacteria bacterium]
MTTGLVLDVVVALLLAATLVYAWRLERRLAEMRAGRAKLERTIAEFTGATARAEASVASLARVGGLKGLDLGAGIDKARAMRDELSFLVERADGQSRQLETLIRAGRAAAPAGSDNDNGGAARATAPARQRLAALR